MRLHIAANNPRSVEDEKGSHVAMLANVKAAHQLMNAVNAHDLLVAALEMAQRYVDEHGSVDQMVMLRDALKLADGDK